MINILKEADFSANNIGKVTIPVVLDDDTLAVLQYVTKYSTSSPQALALDQFVVGMKENGLWDKVKFLALPAFANSLAECFINVKDGISYGPSTTDIYEKVNDGYRVNPLATLSNSTNVASYKFDISSLVSPSDFSIGVYDSSGGMNQNQVVIGTNGQDYISFNATRLRLSISGRFIESLADVNNFGSKGLRSFSIKSADDELNINTCNLPGDGNVTYEDNDYKLSNWASNSALYAFGSICFNGYALSSFSASQAHSSNVSFMFAGLSLSALELATLSSLVSNLMATILS